jgi:hypothetical protein
MAGKRIYAGAASSPNEPPSRQRRRALESQACRVSPHLRRTREYHTSILLELTSQHVICS